MTRPGEGLTLRGLRAVGRWSVGVPRPVALGLVLGWMAFLWYMSSARGRHAIDRFEVGVLWNNLAHAPAFGVLAYGLLLCLPRRADGWPRIDRLGAAVVLGAAFAYACVDELHQGFVPGRVATISDWITDAVGAGCVVWLAAFVGDRGASERGFWARFTAGLMACFAAALLATFV